MQDLPAELQKSHDWLTCQFTRTYTAMLNLVMDYRSSAQGFQTLPTRGQIEEHLHETLLELFSKEIEACEERLIEADCPATVPPSPENAALLLAEMRRIAREQRRPVPSNPATQAFVPFGDAAFPDAVRKRRGPGGGSPAVAFSGGSGAAQVRDLSRPDGGAA